IGHSPPRACISHGVHTRLRQLCLSNIKHIYTNLPPDRLRWPPTARARDLIELQVFARRKEDPDVRASRSKDERGLSDPGHHESMGARRSRPAVVDGQAGAGTEE